ncbi:PorP/SprF family type IX secretion system membrane protein [Parapedobacter sp.]|uniref:PorP/SprF family type IX secretion system membrane protein n=1 Tax=Parapedobacter sp. TaxID=1958893 RepID=UPI002D7F907F|nr:PorP/SprF family type IX secretion system membrane protein [Parapedobacter sp.]
MNNKRKMKPYLITTLLLLLALASNAQQGITYTQHGQIRGILNPAASLIHGSGEISIVGRRQWVGLEGAPTILWGGGHVGLKNFGATVGLNFRHEALAVEKQTEVSAYFAKAVRISESEYVGLSLNAGVVNHNANFSQLDPMDLAFADDIRETDALVGFGVMLYRPDRYYVGLALPRLMLGNLGVDSDNRYNFRNQYFLNAGALFELNSDFHVKPALLVVYAESLRPQADVSAMVFVKRAFGLGINLRSYGEVGLLSQINLRQMGIGYSYQFNANNQELNRRIGNSTHEVGLSYRFGKTGISLL